MANYVHTYYPRNAHILTDPCSGVDSGYFLNVLPLPTPHLDIRL